jgi:diguanylate cyclase (GGDEF)-like protein
MKLTKYVGLGWFWVLAPLALLGFSLEALTWWRSGQPEFHVRPLWLGMLCVFGFLVVAWFKVNQSASKAALSRELLVSVLDTLDVGLEIWDAEDRLVHYNKQINRLRIHFRTPRDIGKTFETLVRQRLEQGQIVAAIGHEKEWLENRLKSRGKSAEPTLKEYAGDQWFRTQEQRTAGGYLVTSWVDVTDLVRRERTLQDDNVLLQQQSSVDALTGLVNRRLFDKVLATELARAERNASPISLLMIDIDHFKKFNDYYGHVAGDECLKAVADVLHRCVRRAGEMVARYGGEEFVLLLPGSDLDHALEVAQSCLELLHQQAIEHKGAGPSATLTFSIGVAGTTPAYDVQPSTIINAADAAMYRAKMAGRACFRVADQADWSIDRETPRTIPAELNAE